MDLIDAYNKASVGELVGHVHPTDPLLGDLLFAKTSDTNIKAFITGVARNAAIGDLEMSDNNWYAKKTVTVPSSQILSGIFAGSQVDDGVDTTFEMVVSCKLPNADFAKYVADTSNPVSSITITCVAV